MIRLWPTPMGKTLRNEGWFIDIVSHERPTEDYIDLVNEPLRENNSQVLGPVITSRPRGHNTAEQSLSHSRQMRFLLTKAEYDQVFAAGERAAFFEGDQAALEESERKRQELIKLEASVPTGRLSFRILSYEIDQSTGFPLHIRFQAELTAPISFKFTPRLKPRPTQCVTLSSSIKVEVKKKHISFGRNFSCFAAHFIERDLF